MSQTQPSDSPKEDLPGNGSFFAADDSPADTNVISEQVAEPMSAETEEEEEVEPAFSTVYDFYEGIYGPLYEHFDSAPGAMGQRNQTNGTTTRWCNQWWNHESVMMRMIALWQGYEAAYNEGGGAVSTWILDHADRHFDKIMDPKGPLSKCTTTHTESMTRYPTETVPGELNVDSMNVV